MSAVKEARTNTETGMRAYPMHRIAPDQFLNETWFWSVTSILKAVAKPALINWAGKVNREAVFQALEHGIFNNTPGYGNVATVPMILRKEADKPHHNMEARAAADVGTAVHAYVEAEMKHLLGVPCDPVSPIVDALPEKGREEYRVAVAGFNRWFGQNKVEPIWSERTLWTPRAAGRATVEHEYAGTFDLYATVNGERLLIDVKTSGAIYPEHWLQLAAGYSLVDDAADYAVLRVGKDGITELNKRGDGGYMDLGAFEAAHTLAHYLFGEPGEGK